MDRHFLKDRTSTDFGGKVKGFTPFDFAIIADPHLDSPEQRGVEKMRQAIEKINNQPNIEFVLIVGDLIWHQSIDQLKALLSGLRVPCHLILGNNDAQRVQEYEQEFGSLYYTFEHASCLFVGLWNSVPAIAEPGNHDGDMDEVQIAWTESTLKAAAEHEPPYQHIFIFAHIPPNREAQVKQSLRMRPPVAKRFFRWCREFSVTACFFGHIHEEECFALAGTKFITTASLNWNFLNESKSKADRGDFGGYRVVRVLETSIAHQFRLTHGLDRIY